MLSMSMTRILIAVAMLASATPLCAQTLTGVAQVIDGDTLLVGDAKVRLFGIDAPEKSQTCDRNADRWRCGEESSRQLASLVGTYQVQCRGRGKDTHGRTVATCSANGVELNRAMVMHGWATAYRSYSQDYVADEARARAAKLGLWTSDFMLPEDYRNAAAENANGEARAPQRLLTRQVAPVPAPMGRCAIKGNRNRKGQWIYHVPGMPYYEATRAEDIFCTEAQAQAAGYRRAIVR